MTFSAPRARRLRRVVPTTLAGVSLLLVFAASRAVLAQAPTAPEASAPAAPESGTGAVDRSDWESGWHVVRPGDTLEGLAERYLGDHDHWRDLHLLNPTVKDPNLLFPGQRVRIYLELPTAKLSAQVLAIARDVSELPTPVPWRPASEGDVLLERDALRTAKAASARLRFDDGATVTLSEDSLVFIRRSSADAAPLPKKEIEIQLGQIDVESAPTGPTGEPASGRKSPAAPEAIELVVGGARSLATSEGGKPLATRSRRGTGDLAQFMVFAGKSTVSSGGASVEVPEGNGTNVVAKAKPGPVEALLPAPAGARPAYGEEVEQAAPEFSWNPVAGADHYKVEVCRDPACGALIALSPPIPGAQLRLEPEGGLPAGELFWRVTAVSPSGLDGYPTPAIRVLAVESIRPATPAVALRTPEGAAVPNGACVAALPDAVVRAVDRGGAALPWTLLFDGQPVAIDELRGRPLAGDHSFAARVTDSRGRSSDSASIGFTVDGAAPWVELLVVHSAAGTPEAAPEKESRRSRRVRNERADDSPAPVAACDSGLEMLDRAGLWAPVPCDSGVPPAAAVVPLEKAQLGVDLRASRNAVAFGENVVGAGGTLKLEAWDVGCGATSLALRIAPSPYRTGRMILEASVRDGAGNERIQAWHLARR